MNDSSASAGQSALAVVRGVTKKTAILVTAGVIAAAGLQPILWPKLSVWAVPGGVLFGGVLGAVNFRWLASAVERLYLRKGSAGGLSTAAAVIVNILKLSAIFVVLFIVIKRDLVNIYGFVAGLSLYFLAVLWHGFGALSDGASPESDRKRKG